MSIFGSIVSAIFGPSKHANTAPPAAPAPAGPTGQAPSPPSPAAPAATARPMTQQEVEAVIQKLASAKHEPYDWKVSIVDLMKLLKLDSSLAAREQLAQELGYTGALDGSAQMNTWLHKQVMIKLAEGGGQVPADLRKA